MQNYVTQFRIMECFCTSKYTEKAASQKMSFNFREWSTPASTVCECMCRHSRVPVQRVIKMYYRVATAARNAPRLLLRKFHLPNAKFN